MKKFLFTLITLIILTANSLMVIAQDNFQVQNAAGTTLLDVREDGVFIPKLTNTQRNANITARTAADNGLLVYDTDTKSFWMWQDTQWVNLGSSEVQKAIADSDGDTQVQVEKATGDNKIRFDIGGTEYYRMGNGRLQILNTGNSIFLGEGAGALDDFTNNRNIGIGTQVLGVNTTGYRNIAIGHNSMLSNTIGDSNVGIGTNALASNTSGRSNNAQGNATLFSNTTGSFNSAYGNSSMSENTTGEYNTAFGNVSLVLNRTGSQNTALGYGADVTAGNLVNATAIGFQAKVDASNKIQLGNANVTAVETAGTIQATAFVGDGSGLTGINAGGGTKQGEGTIMVGDITYTNSYNIFAANEGDIVGNYRGDFSVDLQTQKTDPSQVSSGFNSVIAGGRSNTASGDNSSVGGGFNNVTAGLNSTISGGASNTASENFASIGGGRFNQATNLDARVGGGFDNIASGNKSSIAGGNENRATGDYAHVGGGNSNVASGNYASILGGNLLDAPSYGETVIGLNNEIYTPASTTSPDPTDRLFVVGNGLGTQFTDRSNALTILKNGNVGIGKSNPNQLLDVNGTVQATAFVGDGSGLTGISVTELDGDPNNEIQNLTSVLTQSNDAGASKISNLADPTLAQDAATKAYVDLLEQRVSTLESLVTSLLPPPFPTVELNGLTWQAENLDLEASGAVCYDNNPANCDQYGRLYDFATATATCPQLGTGWRLPTAAEWEAVANLYGGFGTNNPTVEQAFTDGGATGLDIPISGYFQPNFGFFGLGSQIYMWDADGTTIQMAFDFNGVIPSSGSSDWKLPVRCVKD